MTTSVDDDVVWRSLGRLRDLEPDAARAQRVRERCGTLMRRRRQRAEARASAGGLTPLLERALAGLLCVSYLLAIGRDLFRLYSD